MEINRILFPAPSCLYSSLDIPDLIWVPKDEMVSIPCIFMKSLCTSSKILIFFHGNAEDLRSSYDLVDMLRSVLNVNVIAVEYPGYGLYKGKTSETAILRDAQTVYKFIKEDFKFGDSDILIFGRSIGSGPACFIARHNPVGCLLLMSAFTSIKDVVKNVAGRLAKMMVKERFRNIDHMPFIKCPTFLVHGIKDKLVPFSHSQKLHEACSGPCALFLPPKMEHNRFDYCDDLVLPMSTFLAQANIDVKPRTGQTEVVIDERLLKPAEHQAMRRNSTRILKQMKSLT
jgi:pimeloyl-ACP methyl ester carboxylesterase